VPKKHSDEFEDHGFGRSRGGFGTKVHLATDSSRLPLSFCLAGGQAHESRYAKTLLDRVGIIRKSGHLKSRPNAVLADKGYSSQHFREHLKIKGIKVVIPFKSNEKASLDGRYKRVIAHAFGQRDTETLLTLLTHLACFDSDCYCTDEFIVYANILPKDKPIKGKYFTQRIHDKVIGTFIEREFMHRSAYLIHDQIKIHIGNTQKHKF
jgi:transposase